MALHHKDLWTWVLAGQVVWLLCYSTARFSNLLAWLANPVAILGWTFLWGDNGPPTWAAWLDTTLFQVTFGLCFYGLVGMLLGECVARYRKSLLTTRN